MQRATGTACQEEGTEEAKTLRNSKATWLQQSRRQGEGQEMGFLAGQKPGHPAPSSPHNQFGFTLGPTGGGMTWDVSLRCQFRVSLL